MTYTFKGTEITSSIYLNRNQIEHIYEYCLYRFGKAQHITLSEINHELKIAGVIQSPPVEHIRRITGYLVGTVDRFNDGKKAEEHDRIKHDFHQEE